MESAMPSFSQDWFSHNVPTLERILAPLAGKRLRLLEIGVFEGRSTLWFMDHVLTCPESKIWCVDPFTGSEEHEHMMLNWVKVRDTFIANLTEWSKEHDRQDFLRLYESLHRVAEHTESVRGWFDIIYIDGSHAAQDVLRDAIVTWPILRDGGLMGFDDYAWDYQLPPDRKPRMGIDAFLSVVGSRVEVVERGYQLWLRKVIRSTSDR